MNNQLIERFSEIQGITYEEAEEKISAPTDEEILKNIEKITLEEFAARLGKKIEERSPFQEAMTQAIIDKGKELAVEDLKQDLKQELNDFIEKKGE